MTDVHARDADEERHRLQYSTAPRIDTGINNAVGQSSPTNTVTTNGVGVSPTKKAPTKPKDLEKVKPPAGSPVKSPSKSVKSLPRTPEAGPPSIDKKKVPMNKVQVGAAPSPNLKTVRSKIGSLENTSYKPGGGKVKIENRKLDFSKAQSKIAAKNDKYTPSGGDKKITQMKLQWNAKPKVGSLDNATYKPGGGDKKIETVKLDFKDKAKPKVGSKDNAKHVPGGGTIKIETQKVEVKAESKIGSLDNVKHKPGGGDKKIFNDKDYLRQTSSNAESVNGSGDQESTEIEQDSTNPPPTTPIKSRPSSVGLSVTPRALKSSLQMKSPETPKKVTLSASEQTPRRESSSGRAKSAPNVSATPRTNSPMSSENSRPPSTRDLKSPSEKSSSSSSRKSSPKGIHLPQLIQNPLNTDTAEMQDNQDLVDLKLPKLIETSTLASRAELT